MEVFKTLRVDAARAEFGNGRHRRFALARPLAAQAAQFVQTPPY